MYKSGYVDGADEESSKYGDNPIVLDEDSLYDILITVPGIGEKLANKIVERVVKADEAKTE